MHVLLIWWWPTCDAYMGYMLYPHGAYMECNVILDHIQWHFVQRTLGIILFDSLSVHAICVWCACDTNMMNMCGHPVPSVTPSYGHVIPVLFWSSFSDTLYKEHLEWFCLTASTCNTCMIYMCLYALCIYMCDMPTLWTCDSHMLYMRCNVILVQFHWHFVQRQLRIDLCSITSLNSTFWYPHGVGIHCGTHMV